MSVSLRFSRQAFEDAPDSSALAAELRAALAERLHATCNHRAEADLIVEELRALGHALYSWDDDDNNVWWGDDYVHPPLPNRFLLHMAWPDPSDPNAFPADLVVEVLFGPWPRRSGAADLVELTPKLNRNAQELLLVQVRDALQEVDEPRFAQLVSDALTEPDEVFEEFLVSNTLWGGSGSIADQAGLGRENRRRLEATLIALGEQQIADGKVNARTSKWVEVFKQWREGKS